MSRPPLFFVFAVAALALLLPAVALTPAPAFGHSIPAKYSIEPNAQFHEKSELPTKLVISFSERPDPKVSYIRIADAQRQRVDNNDFAITGENGRQAAVTLDTSKFKDGIYTVSWFTMSLDDGHITEGAYVFGVGHDVVVMVPTGGSGEAHAVTSYADAIAQWPLLVAQTAVVGGAITHVMLHRRLEEGSNTTRRFSIIVLASAGAMAASANGIVLLQAGNLAQATGVPAVQALQSLAANSPAGTVWVYRLAASAIVAGSILAYMKSARKPLLLYVALAAGAASLFSNSMLSHNSAAPFLPALAVALDWVHFMAVSAWVGGLFYLAAVFAPATKQSPRQLALALPSFSLVATASLGVIGVTGIYMAWVHLHALDSLFFTPYGTSLAIKLGAALPMVLLGAYHQLKLHRGIVTLAKSGGQEYAASRRFGRTIKAEALVGIGVLFAASILTITSPPAEATMHAGEGFVHRVNVDGTDVALEISPFQPGINTFTVTLTDEGGRPSQNIANVVLRFTNVDAGVGPIVATLQKAGDDGATYSATGSYLSEAGKWEIDFIAQRINAYDLNHSFTETLGSGQAMPGMMATMPGMESTETPPNFDSFAVLTLVLAVAVAGGSAFYARQSGLQMKRTLATLG